MNDIYGDIDNNNPNKICNILIVFRDMFINKSPNPIVTELFIIQDEK